MHISFCIVRTTLMKRKQNFLQHLTTLKRQEITNFAAVINIHYPIQSSL